MNELTRIITLQVTSIGMVDDDFLTKANDKESIRELENVTKKLLNADDVKIKDIQNFIIEKGGSNG